MSVVKFLQDFQGRETNEVFYRLGQEADLPDYMVSILVRDGRAELVKATVPYPPVSDEFLNTITDEPHFAEEPKQEEAQPVENVTTTETFAPKRSKRGKK